jgi:hypothetical protein
MESQSNMKNFNLESEPKIESGFVIPENYFDDFSERLMAKVNESEPKVIPFYKRQKVWLGAAAAVLIIGISTPILKSKFMNTQEITSDYLAYETNISTEDIVEHLTDDDLLAIEKSLKITDNETLNYIQNL